MRENTLPRHLIQLPTTQNIVRLIQEIDNTIVKNMAKYCYIAFNVTSSKNLLCTL